MRRDSGRGYDLTPQELTAQVAALEKIGDQTNGVAGAASRLAERLPKLGTAPPALHLAMRLREAAGRTGLTGEVTAAGTELTDFHRTLRRAVDNYLAEEDHAAGMFDRTHPTNRPHPTNGSSA